jgi:hypothetical protein
MLVPSSDGGGLLDFLKRNAALQATPSGLPSDQAQYGTPSPGAAMAPAVQPAQMPQAAPAMPPQAAPVITAGPMARAAPATAPGAAAPQAGVAPAAAADPLQPVANVFNRGADALGSIARGGSVLGAVRGQYDDPQAQAQQQQARQAQIQNLTARVLVARGVDPQVAVAAVQPGNTDLLKQLITQNFGPRGVLNKGGGTTKPSQAAGPSAAAPNSPAPAPRRSANPPPSAMSPSRR